MPEASVHSSPSNVRCSKYHPGHNTHWIPVLRVYVKTPRIAASVNHVRDHEFTVTIDGQVHNWFFHAPEQLSQAIAANSQGFKSVQDTTFLNFVNPDGGISWFYLAKAPIEPCEQTSFKRYEEY